MPQSVGVLLQCLTLLRNVISLQQTLRNLPSDGLKWLGIQIPIRRSSKELETTFGLKCRRRGRRTNAGAGRRHRRSSKNQSPISRRREASTQRCHNHYLYVFSFGTEMD
ncbi:hypothetical protein NE237_017449 [Protea cynaroides]|uniref:Secreted protein n=1 Tax=Protea cynaroides TaxID=273540 RepID=A0A9Q0K831_9MAGN|nr:hypothetical protein NE237_017449 [Protea cynaroides]